MESYEMIKNIGRGTFGNVYMYRDTRDNKFKIIKMITVELMNMQERKCALTEVEILSMLSHPCIVHHYESFMSGGELCLVMEYVSGGTLHQFLMDSRPNYLEQQKVLWLFGQVVLALHHIHKLNILHRDLKPKNILMNQYHDAIKISDFGISKVLEHSGIGTDTVVGSPSYLSPELCKGKAYDYKVDIWALGCLLYEMLSLRQAFTADNFGLLVSKIVSGNWSPMPTHISCSVQCLVKACLHSKPEKRPTSEEVMQHPDLMPVITSIETDFGRPTIRRSYDNQTVL